MSSRRGLRSVGRAALCSTVVAVSITVANAQPLRASGSNTGDGSTPFTGLARAPEANLFVGAATSAVPIEVPPGRRGLTPSLALTYSSSGATSPYGFGWDLPLGRIQRQSKNGILACDDPRSQRDFVLVLPDRSIECRLDATTQRCVPLIESEFLRIEWHAATPHWEVRDKSGLRYWFGDVQTARAPIYPDDGCLPFVWALTRVEDPNGNYLQVLYDSDHNVSYPDRILYGGNSATGFAPPFEVRFVWGTAHPCPGGITASRPCDDLVLNSSGSFPARLTRLLASVEVSFNAAVVRSYQLQYDFEVEGAEHLARRSYLTAVTLFDANGEALARADGEPASTTFLYRDSADGLGFGRVQDATRPTVLSDGVGRWTQQFGAWHPTVREIFDIDGDGFADLIDTTTCTTAWQVYRGSPAGFATTATAWDTARLADPCHIRAYDVDDAEARFVYDTMDLTGDGIPDFIDVSAWSRQSPYWRVYPGYPATSTSNGGFGPAIFWYAPINELRLTQSRQHFLGWDGTSDDVDLIDMSGDGLPDLVQSGAPWHVWRNTGNGFDVDAYSFGTAYSPLRFTTDSGLQVLGLVDVNGDALPDQVMTWNRSGGGAYSGAWRVRLHSGFGMGSEELWPLPSSACVWGSKDRWNGLRQAVYDGTDVVRDFFDINGDGLPDVVDSCGYSNTHPNWQVYLNRGGGFSAPQVWPAARAWIRDLDDHQRNGGGKTFTDVFDIDGDGMVDQVDFTTAPLAIARNAAGAWCASGADGRCVEHGAVVAAVPEYGRPDLMTQMENGIGGSTYLTYRPSTEWDNTDAQGTPRLPFLTWTLSSIERDDGMCTATACLGGGEHWLRTDIEYAYGLYDAAAREFRGFRTVRSSNAGSRHDTFFHQDALRRGRTESEAVLDDSKDELLSYSYYDWSCIDLDDPSCRQDAARCPALNSCPAQATADQHAWVRLAETQRFATSNGQISHGMAQRNLAWDRFGNVIHSRSFGTATSPVDAFTDYLQRDDASLYLVDRPLHARTVAGTTAAAPTLEAKWLAYDQSPFGSPPLRGNVSSIWVWLDRTAKPGLPIGGPCPEGQGYCVRTLSYYDNDNRPGFGNLTLLRDPAGAETRTTYDADTHLYPETVFNALQFQVTTQYDPACGMRRAETFPYRSDQDVTRQPLIQYLHDSFCRPAATLRPGNTLAAPHTQYRYVIGGPGLLSDVVSTQEEPSSSLRLVSAHALYDALGRRRQVQRDAVVDGLATAIVSDTVDLDVMGRVARSYAPFTAARPGVGAYISPPSAGGAESFGYDAAGRQIYVQHPDQSLRRVRYDGWSTTTTDECFNDGRCAGAKTIVVADAFGRVVEKQTYDGSRFVSGLRFAYDGLGRLLSTTQGTMPRAWNAATTVTMEYDSLGRKIRLTDPDSGLWQYGYDLAGNLIFQDDPQVGRHTESCFDALKRPTQRFYVVTDSFTGRCATQLPGDVSYRYDSYADGFYDFSDGNTALGRLTSVVDESGTTSTHYDRLGRSIDVMTTINSPDGGPSTARVGYVYDNRDRVTLMTYPDGERVRYRYDASGQVQSVKGKKVYLRRMKYDVFGRPRLIEHGNHTADRRDYGGVAERNRLAAIETRRGTNLLLAYRYGDYSLTGQLSSVEDVGPTGGNPETSNSMELGYDGLGRLTSCRTGGDQRPLTYRHDGLGNLVFKEGHTLTYETARPHVLAAVDGVVGDIEHDANGNRVMRAGTSLSFDAEDRLVSINNDAVRYAYNNEGRRVLRVSADGSTTFYFGRIAKIEDGLLSKFYYVGDLLIASQQSRPLERAAAVRSPSWIGGALPTGVVQHYHLDHLNSTHLVTDRRGRVVEQVRYTPYGEVWARFGANAEPLPSPPCVGGQSCRSFTGFASDPAAPLQDAGARVYDPQLGLFLTADPARQFPSPYSYAGGNPISATDPSGAFFGIDDAIFAVVLAVVGNPTVVAVVGGAAQGALVGAAIGGIHAAATGGPVLRGIGLGAGLGALTGGAGGAGGVGAAVAVGAGVSAVRAVLQNQNPLTAALIGAATGALGFFGGELGPVAGDGAAGYLSNAALEIGAQATVGAVGGGLSGLAAGAGFGGGAAEGAAFGATGTSLEVLALGAKAPVPHGEQALHQEFNQQSWYDRSGLLLTMPVFGSFQFRVGALLPRLGDRNAMTLGANVSSAGGSLDLRTLAHELRHVAQAQTLGTLSMGLEYSRIVPAQIHYSMTGELGELYRSSSALGVRLEPRY